MLPKIFPLDRHFTQANEMLQQTYNYHIILVNYVLINKIKYYTIPVLYYLPSFLQKKGTTIEL